MSKSPRSPHVMLLIDTSSVYGRELIEGIGRYAAEHGPWSIYHEDRGLFDPLPAGIGRWPGDGIVTRSVRKSDLKRLLATGLPVVELFADFSLSPPQVSPSEDAIGRLAAEHFIERGLRNLAYFASDWAWWIDTRRQAFARAVRQSAMPCGYFELQPTRHAKRRLDEGTLIGWLESLPKPCGVFAACDVYAIQVTNACRSRGIAVPTQIAVLGADNDPVVCSVSFPPLSSVDLNSPSRRLRGSRAAGSHDGRPAAAAKADPRRARPGHHAGVDRHHGRGGRGRRAGHPADPRACVPGPACERSCGDRRAFPPGLAAAVSGPCCSGPPKAELVRVQIDRAKMLLVQTDLSVEQIAQSAGFAAFEYFVRAFRRETGLTPRVYRKERRVPGL